VATAWGTEVLAAGRMGRPLVGRVARGAELLTADSHHLLAALERRGAPAERLRWVPWGVRADWRERALAASPAEAAELAGLPTGRPLVLSHRGTRPVYRQDSFVRAMAELRDRGSDALGVIVALEPGEAREGTRATESLIAQLGLDANVSVVPPYDHDRIGFAYRAASVCVSVPSSDSAPTSVFEALAVGTPAIVSELPWVHEPVHDEARLRVVPVGDHLALAGAISSALAEPSEDDVAANMQLVDRSFDRDKVFARIGEEYERLAGGGAR
jgi:glycosyltransferase involved in cell wall biosynthesis